MDAEIPKFNSFTKSIQKFQNKDVKTVNKRWQKLIFSTNTLNCSCILFYVMISSRNIYIIRLILNNENILLNLVLETISILLKYSKNCPVLSFNIENITIWGSLR